MEHMIILRVLFLAIQLLLTVQGYVEMVEPSLEELQIMNSCLERYGGLTEENAKRLQRYKQWSDTYEEIPCFTNCYLNKMFNFYTEGKGFHQQNIIQYFGESLYNACKENFTTGKDNCELAYNGFHCLTKLEDDPFVLIDGMNRTSEEAKIAMKECLRKFSINKWEHFKDYFKFPVKEPIPCFTRCLVEKLQLFDQRSKLWHIKGLETQLGVPSQSVDSNNCNPLRAGRNRHSCTDLYQQYTCFRMANNVNASRTTHH